MEIHLLLPASRGMPAEQKDGELWIHRFAYFPSSQLLSDAAMLPQLKAKPWMVCQVPFFMLMQQLALRRLQSQFHFDCIHAHWVLPQGINACLAGAGGSGKPKLLLTGHGTDVLSLNAGWLKFLKKKVYARADRITAVSQTVKNKINELCVESMTPVEVISMGVDTDRFSPEARNLEFKKRYASGPLLLFVGRLSRMKGLEHLLAAMPMILQENPEARLMIVGSGADESFFRRQVVDLAISKEVIFHGQVEHHCLPEIYASADVFICPSLSEGFGLVFAEAMSCQTLTIASDLPALREIIADGVSGCVVPPGDVPALAARVNQVLATPEQATVLAAQGRAVIKNKFSWDGQAEKYRKLIAELCSEKLGQ